MHPSSIRRQLELLLAELEDSANAHDTDRHVAAYARDAALTFVADGEIIRGWEALREKQRQWWNDGKATGTYRYVGEPIFELLADDLALTTVAISARTGVPAGEARERLVAYSALWRRQSEGWRIVYAHESTRR